MCVVPENIRRIIRTSDVLEREEREDSTRRWVDSGDDEGCA